MAEPQRFVTNLYFLLVLLIVMLLVANQLQNNVTLINDARAHGYYFHVWERCVENMAQYCYHSMSSNR